MDYKREREQLNLTAREVAKEAGIPLRRYMWIDDGTREANVFEAAAIRAVLDRAKRRAMAKLDHWNRLNREEHSR